MRISYVMFSSLRNKGFCVKFVFLTAVTMKTDVLWYVTTCNLVQSAVPDLPDLKMQAASSFETLMSIYKATLRLVPKDNNDQISRDFL
jgi:hypothetical protein